MAHGLVERRRRTAARVALYGSLGLVCVAVLGGHYYLRLPPTRRAETSWWTVDWRQQSPVRLLQQYVRIDSTEATGDELAAALYLSTPLEAAGIEVHVERLGEHHANLWAELPGDDPRAVVLASHLDVEPITDLPEWTHPPFAGVLDGPWIHGRGTFDMKSVTIAQLVALLELKARHPHPRRSVILLATASEESGSDLGIRWLLREHPEFVRRFWAVLTEGGVVEARSLESIKYWGTEIGQKRFAELIACAPTKERLDLLRRDIYTSDFRATGLQLDDAVRGFWKVYRPSRDLAEERELLADPEALRRDPARFQDLPAYLRSMMRDELVAFAPEPSAGGGWQMRLLLHLLPHADEEAVRRDLLPAWMTGGVWIATRPSPPPAAISPADHPVMQAIASELAATYDAPPNGPFFLPWTATDSRYLRPLGIPSYGFSPFFMLTPDSERAGRPNERIPMPALVRGAKLYAGVLERLAMAAPARSNP